MKLLGHGVVPTHIDKIITTNNDEIKFVISDVSEKYDIYNIAEEDIDFEE